MRLRPFPAYLGRGEISSSPGFEYTRMPPSRPHPYQPHRSLHRGCHTQVLRAKEEAMVGNRQFGSSCIIDRPQWGETDLSTSGEECLIETERLLALCHNGTEVTSS